MINRNRFNLIIESLNKGYITSEQANKLISKYVKQEKEKEVLN